MGKTRTWRRTLGIGLLGVVVAAMFAGLPASSFGGPAGSTFVVDTTADFPDANPGDGVCADTEEPPHCSLRAAIQEANALPTDDAISVPAGTYMLNLAGDEEERAAGDLEVTGNTTITGAGQSATFIEGNASDRVFEIGPAPEASAPTVTLRDLVVEHGNALNGQDGGGILSNGTVTLDHVTVRDNLVDGTTDLSSGGGIDAWGGSLDLESSTVSGNTVQNYEEGTAQGGGIATQPGVELTLDGSTVDSNTAYGDCSASLGGGVAASGPLTANQSTVSENTAGTAHSCDGPFGHGFGGGIYVAAEGAGSDPALSGITVSDNVAGGAENPRGGGIAVADGADISISNGSLIEGNSAGSGGGIANDGALTVTGSTIRANQALQSGAGIETEEDAALTITSSTVSGNTVTDPAGDGGGLELGGGDDAAISNSTISGNSAHTGGGIAVVNTSASLALSAATVAENSAETASQLDRTGGTVTAVNTLFAGSGALCSGNAVTSEPQGHNLSQDASCLGGPGDVIGLDPKLGPLADNGGPTFTHALLPGSPAIDAGLLAACPAEDQRGIARPQGAGCDIGAFEAESVQPPPPTTTTSTPPATTTSPEPPPPPLPTLSIANYTHPEGDSGTTAFTFALTLSAPSDTAVTVDWSTADGTATAASGDYTAVPPTPLTFTPGQTSQAVTVLVNGDTEVEPDETFFVDLASPVGATIADGQAVGTILNDDEKVTIPRGTNPCTITGTSGDDTITVTVLYPTVVCGLSGNDVIHSGLGGGAIVGGSGNDTFYAGGASTTITLGSGSSVVYACNGKPDVIEGGSGPSVVTIDKGIDTVKNVTDVRYCNGGSNG